MSTDKMKAPEQHTFLVRRESVVLLYFKEDREHGRESLGQG